MVSDLPREAPSTEAGTSTADDASAAPPAARGTADAEVDENDSDGTGMCVATGDEKADGGSAVIGMK
jgi:hypothetical protein